MTNAQRRAAIVAATLWMHVACGCDGTPTRQSSPATATRDQAARKGKVLEAMAQAQREAEKATVPQSVIDPRTPPGWAKSKPRALPVADHGFTIAYDHESGLAVTFYQYTRGLASIPNDVDAPAVKEEVRRAKEAIQQAVQLGYWQAAKEKKSGEVALGDSTQRALWSQFELTVDGATMTSDVYVWVCANAFLKLRCTSRSADVSANEAATRSLLTALGAASKARNP